jgi:hypothetical protein
MKNPASGVHMRSAVLKISLLTAMLLFAAVTSFAQAGHGGGRGGFARGGGGRAFATGGARVYGGAYRYPAGGGHPVSGGGVRYYGGGAHAYYGGPAHYHGWYGYRPYGYYYPHSYVSFNFGWGAPYYYYPAPVYVVPGVVTAPDPAPTQAAPPVVTDPSTPFDVTNEPPTGCYYYDPFCQQQFTNLDDYTDHLASHDHAKTIDIFVTSSGEKLRTLEFAGGYWRVMK